KKLVQLKNYLQRLINPSQVDEKLEFNIHLEAKEYEIEDKKYFSEEKEFKVINGIIKNVIFEKMGIKTTQINCNINETGTKIYTELIDKDTFIFSLEEINEFKYLNNINIKLFFLNPVAKTEFKKNMGLRSIWYGSIFLYKNGFRIHPYGDEGDDWLGLESRKTQGFARYLSNRELMGRIEINDEQSNFKEVSSRDGGIIKTPAYYQLIDFFIKKCLKRLEKYVVEGLDWDNIEDRPKNPEEIKTDSLEIIKQITGQVKDPDKELKFNENLLEIVKEKQVEKLPEIIKNIESLKKSVKDPKEEEFIETQLKALKHALASKLKSLEDEVKQAEKEKKEAEEELKATKKTSLFLSKAISTDEDVKTALNHSIKVTTFSIDTLIKDINQKVNEGKNVSDILPLIDEIDLENQKIQILSKYVSFAGFETKVESIKKDLVLYIKEYLARILNRRKNRLKIEFINENIEFNKRFPPLEISLVIDNLIDNAIKAGATSLKVKFGNIDKNLHLFISDNANGVPEDIKKFIFNRGYTTTDGSGIGLYHVKQILTEIGADIEFIGNNVKDFGKGACFELVFK
ncbi:MAG: HAMP domain-containing histidine kinase, partial [Candidatus Pacebacteria bacterium]|nr:HAMP domain-containing histidine kinase [Candidatus Paceibacterota bacterium]